MRNVYIFPGVPDFLRKKFALLEGLLATRPFVTGWLYCFSRETALVEHINAVDQAFADVDIGSYPQFGDSDHKVRLTFDHHDRQRVEAAMAAFVARVGPAEIQRSHIDG